jgi:2-dehydropantoate 2-reductase
LGPPHGKRARALGIPAEAGQLASALPILTGLTEGCDVLFFGNTAGRGGELIAALGQRALFGFPAVGGTRQGPVVRYVLIRPQKTTLGEPGGTNSARVRRLQALFSGTGFPTVITANIDGWLLAHTAFIVPISFALYRDGTDAARLAADRDTLRLMVAATRQAFQALRAAGTADIPANLRVLYLQMPEPFAVWYWRRALASPRGELWFAAHSRAAPNEMTLFGQELQAAVHRTGRPAPALDALLSRR